MRRVVSHRQTHPTTCCYYIFIIYLVVIGMKFDEDHTLLSFYEQRRNRPKTYKRHSLLHKNYSYFSNENCDVENMPSFAKPPAGEKSWGRLQIDRYESPGKGHACRDPQQYHSPTFNSVQECEVAKTEGDSQEGRVESQALQQTRLLKQQVQHLERENNRQAKFIESVQKMRRAILHSEEDCSLKQLWRWLKTLPQSDHL